MTTRSISAAALAVVCLAAPTAANARSKPALPSGLRWSNETGQLVVKIRVLRARSVTLRVVGRSIVRDDPSDNMNPGCHLSTKAKVSKPIRFQRLHGNLWQAVVSPKRKDVGKAMAEAATEWRFRARNEAGTTVKSYLDNSMNCRV